MPNLKTEMFEPGLSFENFVVTTPVCCPSRSTFLRGQYVHNHKVYMNVAPAGSFEAFNLQGHEASTVGTWLQAAGYETALMGKYLNRYPFSDDKEYVPPGWSEWYVPAKGKPYTSFNYTLNENGVLVEYYSKPEDYITDVLGDKAIDFIQRSAETDAPFFLFLSIYAPHEPAIPAPRHAELFPELQAPRTPGFDEENMDDKPIYMQQDPQLSEGDIARIDELYRLRLQSMQAVDEMLPELVAALEASGQLENTYIIFTSDNGFHMGQHRQIIGKSNPYEEDIRVPFVVRGPGVSSGVTLTEYVGASIDWAPTVAELAGVTPPDYVDGRSLVPLFGENRPDPGDWRQLVLIEFFGHKSEEGKQVKPFYLSIRTVDYVFIDYPGSDFHELYDLENDPYQIESLVNSMPQELLDELIELTEA
ncbi:sulfatase, partial [Chloroflexota bacterium]